MGLGYRCIYYIMVLLRFHIICLYAKLIISSYLLYSCLLFSDLNMASFSPLVTIHNQNKLTGSNYVDWKRNLDIVLTAEEHKYVLTKPCPNFPSLDAHPEEKQRYDRWHKFHEMARCYILASISNVLQHKMQDIELVSDIMLSLKEMFGE